MTILAALGFVFFGVIVGFILVWWYLYQVIKKQPHQLYVFIENATRDARTKYEVFHVFFPDHICPCCTQTVTPPPIKVS